MTTEGARALSTANLEAVLDALLDDDPRWVWQYEEAARAELAALTGRVAELTTVLGLARDTFAALRSGLQDEFWPGRAVGAEDGLAMFRLLEQAQRGVEDALAHGGLGAAGARDEIARKAAAWDWAWEQSRSDTHPTWFDERALLGNALAAVDARRAGGAGS